MKILLILTLSFFVAGCAPYKTTIDNKSNEICALRQSELSTVYWTVHETDKPLLHRYVIDIECSDGYNQKSEMYIYTDGTVHLSFRRIN